MERTGVITFNGGGLTLIGTELKVGDEAPDFTVMDNNLGSVTLNDFAGKTVIISVTPSLDTPACAIQLREFNKSTTQLRSGVAMLNISMDLPFANAKFCAAAGIDGVMTLSDHKDASFGLAYGLLIKELRLLTRALVVINSSGTIAHIEIVPEVTNHLTTMSYAAMK
ncbi:MAG: thiol peroxidase [Candidatus Magnetominusculus sp. LBB02]|nr:thiol peroxidase [Candidatus Magnetominusculus sp. LBB02]